MIRVYDMKSGVISEYCHDGDVKFDAFADIFDVTFGCDMGRGNLRELQ